MEVQENEMRLRRAQLAKLVYFFPFRFPYNVDWLT